MPSSDSDININSDSDSSSTSSSIHRPTRDIMNLLDQVDQSRYEKFRQAGFNKNMMRRLCLELINQSCNPKFIISVCGVAKVFIGELIDIAVKVQNENNESGPLRKSHIYEAYRRMYENKANMRVNCIDPWP